MRRWSGFKYGAVKWLTNGEVRGSDVSLRLIGVAAGRGN